MALSKILLPIVVATAFVLYSICQHTTQWPFSKTKVMDSVTNKQLTRHMPKLGSNSYIDYNYPKQNRDQIGKENATMVMLVRNTDLKGALESIRSLEDRFNRNYKYPWVFLNDVPFDEEFKEKTTLMTSGKTYYELIPKEDWQPPSFIDEQKLQRSLQRMAADGVVYGAFRSYRNMCHFNSGYFYKQKILDQFEWYFRVEPDVIYMCDFQYDPFTLLRRNKKKYGFVLAIHEFKNTIPTLWKTVKEFMKDYPHLLHPNNALDFITTNELSLNSGYHFGTEGRDYNLCHFWSNFEIGNLNFFRSEEYNTFFNYLDRAGGFYYERWGDAPVHTLALSLLLDKNEIHHFEDIGYYHPPHMSCPTAEDIISSKRCICKAYGPEGRVLDFAIDTTPFTCVPRWWRYGAGKTFLNEIDKDFDV